MKSFSHIYIIALFLFYCILSGCSKNKEVVCTTEAKSGLNIYVNDSETLQILISDVEVKAISGSHEEILLPPISDASPFTGAYEEHGIYKIVVSKPGYFSDSLYPIIVGRDECHIIPQVVYIKLRKQ